MKGHTGRRKRSTFRKRNRSRVHGRFDKTLLRAIPATMFNPHRRSMPR